jgi:DNA-binding GntR family transcriptional regulator
MSRAVDLKVPKRPLDQRAADILREQILSGKFPPGHRLVEATLAEMLSVSRGTVRAALSELGHEGLVEQIAYTRWAVPELSPEDGWELYTLRSSLEGLAASLAAEKLTPEGRSALKKAFADLSEAVVDGKRGAVAVADSALHQTIIEVTGHRRLVRQYAIIAQQVQRYIASSNALLTDINDVLVQHEPIVTAILAGDAERAGRLAREHNLVEGRALVDHLSRVLEKGQMAPATRIHAAPASA